MRTIHHIDGNEAKWYCEIDPRKDFYFLHESPLDVCTDSGKIFMVVKDTEQEVKDLIFSTYEVIDPDEESKNDHGYVEATLIQIDFSAGYTEVDAQNTINAINAQVDFLSLNYIKHPDREEYAIPFQDTVFNAIPAGPLKTALEAQAAAINAAGRRKTIAEMKADGWF